MEILSGTAFTVAVAKVPLPAEWGLMEVHKSLRPLVEEIRKVLSINAKFID